jgi:hypothetical protein
LAQADALVSELKDVALIVGLRSVLETIPTHDDALYRQAAASQLAMYVHRALAIAEVRAPVAARAAFIPVGNAFDAMVAVGRILGGATRDLLIVDPYMDEKTLADFAPLAHEGIPIRLLADEHDRSCATRNSRATNA